MQQVYQNAVAPESFSMIVTQGASAIDLTTVSAATFIVRRPDQTLMTWTASLGGATPTSLSLAYPFQAGDTAMLGGHVVVAKLTVPGGTIRTVPQTFPVVDQFQI